ncbi:MULTISPECIES: hypothetical protein [unclassified Pseudomonas]|uniref:hypothetical protein n=1 Tax=Pseudomonas imrae TaxID=2992837 RepID=UPI003965B0F9
MPLAVNADDAPAGCVEAEVGGYKSPDYACLSQQMSNNPQGTKAAQKNRQAQTVEVHKRAPHQIGLSTPAATGVRMGNTFGNSVTPQRP